jgi:hypothetical protein
MSMPCQTLCHHKLRRFHWSCLYCRIRRFFYGKMDRKKYHYNRYLGVVMPEPDRTSTYVLIIDENRHLRSLKAAILKRLLTIVEMLAN